MPIVASAGPPSAIERPFYKNSSKKQKWRFRAAVDFSGLDFAFHRSDMRFISHAESFSHFKMKTEPNQALETTPLAVTSAACAAAAPSNSVSQF
jgi:hypothetical protein